MKTVSTFCANPTYKLQATQYTTQSLKAMLHSSSKCMMHSPFEAERSSASQEILAFYGSRRFISTPTTARRLSLPWQQTIQSCRPSHFSKAHFNIILPSMPVSSKWSLSFRFPQQNPVSTSALTYTRYTVHHSSWLDHLNIWWGLLIIMLLVM
jgi:hypothetical protein